MSRYITVASVSLSPIYAYENNLPDGETMTDRILQMLDREICPVLWDKPDLIVLPEYCDLLYGGVIADSIRLQQENGDRILEFLQKLARDNRCYITYPSRTVLPDGTARNTVRMIDREGAVMGAYHKNYVMVTETENYHILAGRDIPVFSCDFGRVCTLLCFDLNFEENRKRVKKLKPDRTLFCSRFHGSFQQNFFAYDTRSYFVSALAKLPCEILSPLGEKVAGSTNYYPYVTARINLDCAVCHLDFNEEKFRAAKEKYGDKIRIHDPGCLGSVLLTSETAEFSIQRVLREFEIEELDDYLARSQRHRKLNME
jgi:hypothetical protein